MHICNINMGIYTCMYIINACGHELSGCVCAQVYSYNMPGHALQIGFHTLCGNFFGNYRHSKEGELCENNRLKYCLKGAGLCVRRVHMCT